MIKYYKVADYALKLVLDEGDYITSVIKDYETEAYNSGIVFSFKLNKTNDDIHTRKTELIKISDDMYFYSEDDKDVLFYHDSIQNKVVARLCFDKAYENADISAINLNKSHGLDDKLVMYNLVGTAFNYMAMMHGGFVFHSSSVAFENKAYAFSAPSGTGKSTHTSLWLKNFEGSYIVNDDSPLIYAKSDGTVMLSGTPWAGTTGINKNVTLPLAGIAFLKRAEENHIEPISSMQALPMIFEGVKNPLNDAMMSKLLDTINIVLKNNLCYCLGCNMHPDAAHTAYNGIKSHIKEKLQ